MKISPKSLGLFLVLASCTVVAQSPEEKPGSAIEIVAVRGNRVDVKLRSLWSYPVSIWVRDTPRRLNELGYYLGGYTGKKWTRLKPREGLILAI